jgi:hypothetical protein
LTGSKGYRISLSSYINHKYNRITLSAEKNGAYARYIVKGEAHNGVIRATYPGLGRIAVHFVPSKVKELPPNPGCDKPSGTVDQGTFLGTIRFRGEKGFTSVDAGRAHGSIVKHFRQLCRAVKRAVASRGHPGRAFEGIELSAKTGNVQFTAENTVGDPKSTFHVRASENRKGIQIGRGIREVTGRGFTYDAQGLTEARVAPPAPFMGQAHYSGSPVPEDPMPGFYTQGTLSGSLKVYLPGLGVVPLGGSGVKAQISRSVGVTD